MVGLNGVYCTILVSIEMYYTYKTSDFKVGEASYNKGGDSKTVPEVGCTVFRYGEPVRCVLDKLGGAVGTYYGDDRDVFSDEPDDNNLVNAVCFAGGSLNGLSAIGGVAEGLAKENIEKGNKYDFGMYKIPVVKGAITFSGAWGKDSNWKPPDAALGREALESAVGPRVSLGQHGAGCNAEVGSILRNKEVDKYGAAGGQGAYCETKDGVYCAVYCNLNAKGAIFKDGKLLYPEEGFLGETRNVFRSTNVLIHTNAKCKSMDLMRQLARQVHVSIARVIHPYSAHSDGDVLFLTSSETKDVADTTKWGLFFSSCLWKAVHSVAYHHLGPPRSHLIF